MYDFKFYQTCIGQTQLVNVNGKATTRHTPCFIGYDNSTLDKPYCMINCVNLS